jgi:hypothetical protein
VSSVRRRNLPQTTTLDLFTVSGGRVLVFLVLGQVTTVIQNQANNTKLIAHPTAGSDVDICAVVDIANLEVGGKLIAPNVAATALGKSLAGASFGAYGFTILDPGVLRLSCAASNTGQVKWTLFYAPLDPGASVAAA